ncbi:MAG: YjjW family glycine radical enzyme activase, partial [Shewanella sp.]
DLAHLSCLVDSNGALSEPGWQRLLPFVDGAMIDLKAWHSDCHRRLTGQDNVRVLASLQLLAKAGKLAELRLLYVPGQSDFIDERGDVNPALLAFLHQLASPTIRLNGFRHHGVKGVARTWQQAQQEELAALADALTAQGLGPIIQPVLFA